MFETFPRPEPDGRLDALGRALDAERRKTMRHRDLGLTSIYNLVNSSTVSSADDVEIGRLRQLHSNLDEAAAAAYGWDDIDLDHGFHTYRQMTRWTITPEARIEVLDRLLEENHRRASADKLGSAICETRLQEGRAR